ncbi:MAG: hypothetical protein LBC74_10715 [Planctomycetaceae bacterium]|nr:hypothetical protein [Planctomycetaceae bacterium]
MIFFVLTVISVSFCVSEEVGDGNWKLRTVPFTEVQFDGSFWSPRLKTSREISIPHNYDWCKKTGRLANFRNTADCLTGAQCSKFQGLFSTTPMFIKSSKVRRTPWRRKKILS